MARKVFLPILAGLFGPVLFFATTQYGAAITPGYSQVSDAVSALSQRGAAAAGRINALFFLAAALQMALGWGLARRFAGQDRAMAAAGWLILACAAMGAAIAAFFPMDPMGGTVTPRGVMHLVLVGLSALALVAAMILARGNPDAPWFRPLTWACLCGMVAGGALSALAGWQGWPVLGVGERLTQDAYLIWLFTLAALALVRLRRSA